jgi:hypothetical protein
MEGISTDKKLGMTCMRKQKPTKGTNGRIRKPTVNLNDDNRGAYIANGLWCARLSIIFHK